MGLIVYAVLGFIIGIVIGASLDDAPGGPPLTGVIGLTGALIGGIFSTTVTGADPLVEFWNLWGLLGAVAGAIIVMALYALIAAPGSSGRQETTGSGDATTGRQP